MIKIDKFSLSNYYLNKCQDQWNPIEIFSRNKVTYYTKHNFIIMWPQTSQGSFNGKFFQWHNIPYKE